MCCGRLQGGEAAAARGQQSAAARGQQPGASSQGPAARGKQPGASSQGQAARGKQPAAITGGAPAVLGSRPGRLGRRPAGRPGPPHSSGRSARPPARQPTAPPPCSPPAVDAVRGLRVVLHPLPQPPALRLRGHQAGQSSGGVHQVMAAPHPHPHPTRHIPALAQRRRLFSCAGDGSLAGAGALAAELQDWHVPGSPCSSCRQQLPARQVLEHTAQAGIPVTPPPVPAHGAAACPPANPHTPPFSPASPRRWKHHEKAVVLPLKDILYVTLLQVRGRRGGPADRQACARSQPLLRAQTAAASRAGAGRSSLAHEPMRPMPPPMRPCR